MQTDHLEPVTIGSKTITFRTKEFDDEIDIDSLLQVDYYNIIGDLITFPVVFNRISILKAEAEDLVDQVKLDLDILIAQRWDHYRLSLVYDEEIVTSSGKRTGTMKKIRPTEGTIESHISKDELVIEKKQLLLNCKRTAKIIDGLYWAAKSKDKKLEVISAKIKPEDYENEILEGEINTVLIKVSKALIPNHKR